MKLVNIQQGEPTTTSIVLAEGVGRSHEAIIKTIRRYESDINEFGLIGFRIRPRSAGKHGGGETEYAILNEEQTTFLFTLLRNSPFVVEFKKRLVKEFFNLRRKLTAASKRQFDVQWQESRTQGKIARREVTDSVQLFVAYAESQGSKNAKFYYKHITTATYKAIFVIQDSAGKSFRDMLDTMQLSFLQTAEYVATKALEDGMEQHLPYKDIFKLAKSRIEAFAGTIPTTNVISHRPQLLSATA